MRSLLVMALAAGSLVAAAGPTEDAGKAEAKKLLGTWKVVDVTLSGKKLEGTDLGEKGVIRLQELNLVFIFEGDKWETRALGKVEARGTFKLDPGKKPKTFDGRIVGEEGTQLGIYELEGDKLKLCLSDRGRKERPSDFSSTKDNQCILIFLERQK